MTKIQHVFFDLDHTLWDFDKNSDLTFEKVFRVNNLKVDLNAFLEVYKPINFEFWKLFREEKVTKEALRYGRLKNSFDALNHTVSDEVIVKMSVDYLMFLPDFNYLFDGTFELLDYLNDKYQLHIITNGFEEVQNKKMISSNIYHYFDKIITSESVGVKKPNPKVFTYALEVANAHKDNSIMIGDNIEADIEGALSVGMQAIHCNFYNVSHNKSNLVSVSSLLEIKQYL
ncbi:MULTISPECIES: YjjG family noncanonical pyrimidine nucleotidase [unclassified Polaribacter]|uniref:YjjG family noncanonical pyrimidine nucleotidase n=1 Tax=unclassified Polaribacter TaxID=196858 RepID=UPI001C4E5328|nr:MULTISPECIES: YjjG family noncanonical pyrimidine nucleotidase [unclassified Polaribacter]QXP62872.1 noncanonical pyrimidine nucleotidase, YjjG family [Polaribacter sp. HaHaR_3_91]QXP68609.1 noncanonical pyrimidine nucleotidase, YjjG family [Polaribacter sp. AHE13PA]QXP70883.1 noncanonical pyrimidine nucleotidase, YjjG family [Polaribacter sp. R2A056_3_33]